MICPNCESDNPRTAIECIACGSKMNVIRCKCGFLSSIMDQHCGNCGSQLIKASAYVRMQKFETLTGSSIPFTEQELMTLIDIQRNAVQAEVHQNKASQVDIDKLFG
jgi:hypothetical protein